jgi:hypothetical protein
LVENNALRLRKDDTDFGCLLGDAIFDDDKDVPARTKVLFDPKARAELVRCDVCFESSAHSCLEATGLELARKVFAPTEGGRSICLFCFQDFSGGLHLLGHYLVHTPEELEKIGISEQLVLKYINEHYPRLRDE